MKILMIVFLCLPFCNAFSQTFRACKESEQVSGQTAHTLKSLVDAPHKAIKLEIDISELKNLHLIDATKFTKLQLVEIKITEDPQAPDETKKNLVNELERELQRISILAKAPQLKWVRFAIGEGLYITNDESLDREKSAEINLKRAYQSVGIKAEKILPNVQICGYDWGW